jgi:hypothetical protein
MNKYCWWVRALLALLDAYFIPTFVDPQSGIAWRSFSLGCHLVYGLEWTYILTHPRETRWESRLGSIAVTHYNVIQIDMAWLFINICPT